jgi:hypothetical protein
VKNMATEWEYYIHIETIILIILTSALLAVTVYAAFWGRVATYFAAKLDQEKKEERARKNMARYGATGPAP